MPSEVKIYKIQDFIRQNESGELTRERITDIIHEIAALAHFHPEHNILFDFRKTTLPQDYDMADILETVSEMEKFKDYLKEKIANVIPDTKDRLWIAKQTESALQLKGIKFRSFTDFEAAIDWLADVEVR